MPKNFSVQVNGNYESHKVVAQGTIRETFWADVAVRKNLFNNKATIVLNCADIFKSHRFVNDYDFGPFDQTIDRVKETRIGNITFTYRFGKTDFGKDIATNNAGGGKHKPDEVKTPTKDKDTKGKQSAEDRDKNMKDSDDNESGGGGQGSGGQKNK